MPQGTFFCGITLTKNIIRTPKRKKPNMKKRIPFKTTKAKLNIVFNGEKYSMNKNHKLYEMAVAALEKSNEEHVEAICSELNNAVPLKEGELKKFENVDVCNVCGSVFSEFPMNPYPISENDDDVCCSLCDSGIVIPARHGEYTDFETMEDYVTTKLLERDVVYNDVTGEKVYWLDDVSTENPEDFLHSLESNSLITGKTWIALYEANHREIAVVDFTDSFVWSKVLELFRDEECENDFTDIWELMEDSNLVRPVKKIANNA